MSANIELLELIAELNMSEDKSRKALGAEIKRLMRAQTEELAAKDAEIERLREMLESIQNHAKIMMQTTDTSTYFYDWSAIKDKATIGLKGNK